MGQAVWTGSISFGLVNIPVRLYPATEPKDVRFHLYDRRTGKRVRYERVTRAEDAATFEPELPLVADDATSRPPGPVARSVSGGPPPAARPVETADVVRGVELPSGDLVTVSEPELVSIAPERSRTIAIEEFVHLAEIDPVFYEKSYHVGPVRGAGAEKPYLLLLRAMQAAGMVGIGRFVLRTKPHLVAIRPLEQALALETLFFADEVRSPEQLTAGLLSIHQRASEMAARPSESEAAGGARRGRRDDRRRGHRRPHGGAASERRSRDARRGQAPRVEAGRLARRRRRANPRGPRCDRG